MRLRPATLDDLPTLSAWDEDPVVAAASGADDAFDWAGEVPRAVDWREVLIAEEDGRPVGVLVAIDPAREETHYWGDCASDLVALDIWIGDPADRGRGLGATFMRLALDRVFADPRVAAVLLDPLAENVGARRFYERLGFVAVGPRRFGEDACVVYRLDRAAWTERAGAP